MHLKIAEIEDEYHYWHPWLVRQVLYADFWPDCVSDVFYDTWSWLCQAFDLMELGDRSLVLEDGAHCSAVHCCDLITDHEISDHPPVKE